MGIFTDNCACHSVVVLLIVSLWTGSSAFQRGRVNAFFQNTCAATVPNPCQQICTDIQSGGFFCQCQTGFVINKDGMTCTELSELSADSAKGSPSDQNTENHIITPHGKDTSKNESHLDVVTTTQHPHGSEKKEDDDSNVVHVHSIGLKNGLPPLQSDSYVRLKSDSGVVLNRDFYNTPEGGSRDSYDPVGFDFLNILEGGDYSSENTQWDLTENGQDAQSLPSIKALCDEVVCENNGTCAVMESKAVCQCLLGTFGESCERAIEVNYPKFLGTGYLALPLQYDVPAGLNITIEFKPESPNGLLLFSSQPSDACTDFFSVVLEDGFVVYRFGCGTGMAVLKTYIRVTLATWNTLVVTKSGTSGSLHLNTDHLVEGGYQVENEKLSAHLNVYLGGYHNMTGIINYVSTHHKFVGCIQELTINGHSIDFRKQVLAGELQHGVNVGECSEHVCDEVKCLNGGTCTVKSADQHVCLCSLGFHGDSCDKDSPVHIPYFSDHSYMEFPGLERSVLSYTEIVLVFKPTSGDGTLLYNGYSKENSGDFISLALQDGHLEFRFDLGTGPAVIRSRQPLALNVWHLVRASRTGLMGTLDVDGQVHISGHAEGAYTQLTLLDGLFVGGHPNYDHTSKHANLTKSFTGCLQKVAINKQVINLMSGAVTGVNIGPCSHPCTGRPCMNGGDCKPHLDTYMCSCPIGFGNTNCEEAQEYLPNKPMFKGQSYLMYKDNEITKRVAGSRMDLQLYIRPRGRDGLLFWSGEDQNSKSTKDYIAIGFYSGSLQLRYNLGSGEALIGYNDSRMFDGKWHFIRVQRDKQDSYIEIDKKEIVEGSSPGGYTSLNTNKMVYLGGMPNIAEKTGGRFTSGFVGCVRGLRLATDYDVKLLTQAQTGRNVDQCRKKMFS